MVVKRVKGNTHSWKLWVDVMEEGSDLCLTQFLVSNDATAAPFTSIQTAYNAAKAAGHGVGNPAQVLVCPGTYTEDVTLDTPEIDVIGVAQDSQGAMGTAADRSPTGIGQTILAGSLTIDLVGAATAPATTARWQGIDIRPPAGAAIAFGGPNNAASYIYVTDCQIVSNTEAIQMANTGITGFQGSVLDIQRCSISAEVAGATAIQISGIGAPFATIRCTHCRVMGAVSGGSVAVVAFAAALFESCFLSAETGFQNADGIVVVDDCFVQSFGAATAAILNAAAAFHAQDTFFDVDPDADFVVGDGLFVHDAMTFRAGVPPWDTALVVSTSEAVPQEAHIETFVMDGGVEPLTSETNAIVESSPGGGIVLLPPVSNRPGVLRLKLGENNVGAVTVDAQAGEFIRLAGAAPVASVPLTNEGFFLVSNPITGYWEGWEFGGGGAVNCLNQFLVSPVPGAAPFTTISAAYAAAVVAGFGHGGLGPAQVVVCPGFYFETVLMTTAGIDVVAIDKDRYNTVQPLGFDGDTLLFGDVVVDLSVGLPPPAPVLSRASWQGIDLQAVFGPVLLFGGPDAQFFQVSDCRLSGVSETLVFGGNSGVFPGGDPPGPPFATPSTLSFVRCGIEEFTNPNGGGPEAIVWGEGILVFDDCRVESDTDGLITMGGGEIIAVDTSFFNAWIVDDANVICTRCDIAFGFGTGLLMGPGFITFEANDCRVGGRIAASPGGVFVFDEYNEGPGGLAFWDPTTVAVVQKLSVQGGSAWVLKTAVSGSLQIGQETNMLGDTGASGAFALLLPPAVSRYGPIRVKEEPDGAGALTLTPQPAENINGGGAGVGIVVPAGGITLISDGGLTWRTVG